MVQALELERGPVSSVQLRLLQMVCHNRRAARRSALVQGLEMAWVVTRQHQVSRRACHHRRAAYMRVAPCRCPCLRSPERAAK